MKPYRELGDAGASAVEYSVLIGGVAAVLILAVIAVGTATRAHYDDLSVCVATQGNSC